MENLAQVETSLNYLGDAAQKPTTYMYRPPEGVEARTGRYTKFPAVIRDARPLLGELSLDKQGFVLVQQHSAVKDFYNDAEVRAVYYPEVEWLVRESTGAARVLVFDHNVRNRQRSRAGERGIQEPVKVAHNDYTVKSGPQRVRDLLPAESEALLRNRFTVINVWRPIRGPVEDNPLAVCDARSIAPADLVTHDLIYRERVGEVYSLAHNPAHRWFYFPRMQGDEVMLIKCYDSDVSRARFTAHSAFDDPTSVPNAAPRESIEVRTLTFFAA